MPDKTNHNLYSALLELELANSIIDLLVLSKNEPEKRLIAAFRYAKQLLGETKGLYSSDSQKVQEVLHLIDICDNPDILKDLSEYNYPGFLVAAANALTDIMQHTFFTREQTEEIFGNALMEHIMLRNNPVFQQILDDIK